MKHILIGIALPDIKKYDSIFHLWPILVKILAGATKSVSPVDFPERAPSRIEDGLASNYRGML